MRHILSEFSIDPIVVRLNGNEKVYGSSEIFIFDYFYEIMDYLDSNERFLINDKIVNDVQIHLNDNKILHIRTDDKGNLIYALIHELNYTSELFECENKIRTTRITENEVNIILNDIKNNEEHYMLLNIPYLNEHEDIKKLIKNIHGSNRSEFVNMLYNWILLSETSDKYKYLSFVNKVYTVKIAPYQFIKIITNVYGNDIAKCELFVTTNMNNLHIIEISNKEASMYISNILNNNGLFSFNKEKLFNDNFKLFIKELYKSKSNNSDEIDLIDMLYVYVIKIENDTI